MNKTDILGVYIAATNIDDFSSTIIQNLTEKCRTVLFPDLSVLSKAAVDPELANIINNVWAALPDGKPSEFIARLKGYKNVSTVSGYKLIHKLLQETDGTHYFYGSTPGKLNKIKDTLSVYDPDNKKILGYKSPPFVSIEELKDSQEIMHDLKEINTLKPDYIWIGLSSPKQDYLIHHHSSLIDGGYMLGVGGVFDYLSGDVRISPEWMKKAGLRWIYRLYKEPIRLFPKYSKIAVNLIRYYAGKRKQK